MIANAMTAPLQQRAVTATVQIVAAKSRITCGARTLAHQRTMKEEAAISLKCVCCVVLYRAPWL